MSVETLLTLAEQGGFLDAKTTAKLRVKLAEQGGAVSTNDLAALLVKKGLLTSFQSEKLLAAANAAGSKELGLADDSSADSDSTFRLGPGKRSDTKKSLELLDDMDVDRMTLLEAKQSGPANDLPELSQTGDLLGRLRDLDEVDEFDIPVAHTAGSFWQLIKRAILQRSPKRGQRWDSSLMLGGGGLLLLLTLVGAFLYFVLASGSGDEMFQMAEDDYKAQLYAQALQKYDRFVEKYPKHNKASLARTRMGLARIRADVSSQDWGKSVATVQRELPQLKSEATFDTARSELAGILPDIYAGFVARASEIQDTDAKERFLDQGDKVLEIIEDADNIPSSLRRQIQSRLDTVGNQSQQIRQEIARRRDILKSLDAIQQAIAVGDSAAAYAIRDTLLDRHPGAGKDVDLQAAIEQISNVEQQSVRVVDQIVKATATPRPVPDFRAIPLVLRSDGQASDWADRSIAINARGAVYGIAAETGEVLWRRWLGFESNLPPVATSSGKKCDWLIMDQRHGELQRVTAASGDLVWRVETGPPAGVPIVDGDHLYQANSEGALYFIDREDGSIQRKVTFPQKLSSPPAVDHENGMIFQAADHSTLYVLDAESLECTRTIYTGHLAGMVTVAPAITRDFVMVVENSATDYCLLHVFVRDGKGGLTVASEPLRLKGIVAESPVTYGRNIIVTTDRGAVYVMEAAADNLSEPVRVFAQIHPRTDRTANHFGLLTGNRIFIAGWGLAEFEILSARGSLERRWAEQVNDSHFVAPVMLGDTLVTARWAPLTHDVIVEATRTPAAGQRMPETIWQTHLATQPANPPVVLPDRSVMLAGRNGAVWRIDNKNVSNTVVESLDKDVPPMGALLITQDGAQVFAGGDERPLWMYRGPAEPRNRLVTLDDPGRHRVDALPALLMNGMLLCTVQGPVYFVDPASGKQLATPFTWPANFSANARWRTPAVAGNVAVVANNQGILHRLTLAANDERLISTHAIDLKFRTLGAPVMVNGRVFVLLRGRREDRLIVLSNETLEVESSVQLEQRVLDPIYVVDDLVLVQSQENWQTFRGTEKVWQSSLPQGPLAGAPVPSEEGWLCTSRSGHIFWADPQTGELQATLPHPVDIEIGQALGESATRWNKTILAAGHDSTLHVVPLNAGGARP